MRLPLLVLLLLAAGSALAAGPALTVTVRDAKGQPAPDAVVSLHRLPTAAPLPANLPMVEIAQRDQEFIPYVTVVPVGTTIEFPNRDDIQHHIYSLSKAKRFEKPLYAPGAHEAVVFDTPGIITLGCNIHDWMVAYIVVLPTLDFAKTDAAGRATLTPAAGTYRLEIWHPRATQPFTEEISLQADTTRTVDLKLKPDRRIRRAPETKSGGY